MKRVAAVLAFSVLYVYEGCSFLYNNAEQNESLKTQGGDRMWITL